MVDGENMHLKLERIQHTEAVVVIISKIMPYVWSTLMSHGVQDTNQSESNRSKKDPMEGVSF